MAQPGLTLQENLLHTLYNSSKNFDNLFNGKLHTTTEITNTLKEVDNFLQEIFMPKTHQLTNPRNMFDVPIMASQLPNNSNILILMADEGDSFSCIAIFPIQDDSNIIQITKIPVPQWVTEDLHETALPHSTIEFNPAGFLTNSHQTSSVKCLMQIAENMQYPQ